MPEFPELSLSSTAPRIGDAAEARAAMIEEAKGWPSGRSTNERHFTMLSSFPAPYEHGVEFSIRLGKPGKETRRAVPNPFDMTPTVFRDDEDLRLQPSFAKQLVALEEMVRIDPIGAELVGALFVRNAFLLDHRTTGVGRWRYSPTTSVLQYIEARSSHMFGVPMRVALYLFDAIALNEDVKYLGTGARPIDDAVGRTNNLLTLAHAIACFLGRLSTAEFIGKLTQRPGGVAPLLQRDLRVFSPLLVETGSGSDA